MAPDGALVPLGMRDNNHYHLYGSTDSPGEEAPGISTGSTEKGAPMLVPVHRAVSAMLHVMLVAFVTLSARVQHGVQRSKHWFAPATLALAAVALIGPFKWMW